MQNMKMFLRNISIRTIAHSLLLIFHICIPGISNLIEYNTSNTLETWDLNFMKGVMRGQTLKVSKIIHPLNDLHTCYQVTCEGVNCNQFSANPTIRFCYPAIVITGLPKCGTSAIYDLLKRYKYVITMHVKENCPYAHRRPHWQYFNSLPNYDSINENSLIIDACIDVNANMLINKLLHQPTALYIVMTRNYADMLWSSYNYWCSWEYDGITCDSSKWTRVGTHMRSNKLFHEIIINDMFTVKSIPHQFSSIRQNQTYIETMKSPLFIKKPCAYGGGYFSEFFTNNLWLHIHRNQTLAIAAEELETSPFTVWEKIVSRISKIKINDLKLGNFTQIRYNTQDHRGPNIAVPIESYQKGVFAISHYQEMFNETREVINACWMDDCLFTSQLTGYLYESCKNQTFNLIQLGTWKHFNEVYEIN